MRCSCLNFFAVSKRSYVWFNSPPWCNLKHNTHNNDQIKLKRALESQSALELAVVSQNETGTDTNVDWSISGLDLLYRKFLETTYVVIWHYQNKIDYELYLMGYDIGLLCSFISCWWILKYYWCSQEKVYVCPSAGLLYSWPWHPHHSWSVVPFSLCHSSLQHHGAQSLTTALSGRSDSRV